MKLKWANATGGFECIIGDEYDPASSYQCKCHGMASTWVESLETIMNMVYFRDHKDNFAADITDITNLEGQKFVYMIFNNTTLHLK